jgi:hypothetical protein
MATATGDCHVCGAEQVSIHLLAACNRCRAAAGRFNQQPGETPGSGRRLRRPTGSSYDETFCCSFCGRKPNEVRKMVSGPWVFICDGCVALASEAMRENLGDGWALPEADESAVGRRTLPGHAASIGERETTEVGQPPTHPGPRKARTRR